MRTLRILTCGWLIGGLAIVALAFGMPASSPAEPAASTPRAVVGVETAPAQPAGRGRSALLLPVAGIQLNQLKDNFTQPRGRGRTHGALDILAPRGTPVVAAVDGTVVKLFNSKAGGITVYQFDLAEERVYYYAHLERYANGLHEGQFLKQGDVLGYVGTSGNAPAGTPHLHFAIEVLTAEKRWWKGTPVNPYPLLTAN